MSLTGLLDHRIARFVALAGAAVIGAAAGWPLGPLSAVLLGLGLVVAVKLAMEAARDAAASAKRSRLAVDRVAEMERRLARDRESAEHDMNAIRDDLRQVRSGLEALRSRTERLERQLEQLRRDERQHANAHAGDEALRTVADAVERVVRQWRHDNQLAPQGQYGPPEARLAEGLASLRARLDLRSDDTGEDGRGSAGLAVDERSG